MSWVGFVIAAITMVITAWTWGRFRGAMKLLESEQQRKVKVLTTEHDARVNRLRRESEGRQDEKTVSLVKDLASTYDAISEALKHDPDDVGIQSIKASFLSNLRRHDVTLISPDLGDEFLPAKHEGIESRRSEIESGKIAFVFRDGLAIHDRCVRSALVAISAGIEKNEEE